MYVNHALVANFNAANMSFYAIRENKIHAKISEFTVTVNFLNSTIYFFDYVDHHDEFCQPKAYVFSRKIVFCAIEINHCTDEMIEFPPMFSFNWSII